MTSGIIDTLIADVVVQGLVGLNEAGDKYKVYPFVAPQNTEQPYITVAKTSNNTQSQGKEVESTLDYPTYDVLCWAKNFRTTELLHEAVRNCLDNTAWNTDDYVYRRIWLITDRDSFSNDSQMYVHIATYGAEMLRPLPT